MIKLLPLPWFAKTLLLQRRTFVLANKKTITKRYEENERYQNINNQKRKQKQSYDLYDTSRTHQNKGYQPQSIKNNNKNTRTQPSQTSHNYPPKNVRSDAKNRYTSHHEPPNNLSSLSPQQKEILNKPTLSSVDLAFLYLEIKDNRLLLNESIIIKLKESLQTLPETNSLHIDSLIKLAYIIGMIHIPQSLIKEFIKIHEQELDHKIDHKELKEYPIEFLKRIGFRVIEISVKRSIEEFGEMIRIFGLLLSVKEFKKVDKMCCEMLERMTLSQIVRMFGICCQLRKKGEFISNAQNTLIEQRANLSNKDLLLTSALFLEYSTNEAFNTLTDVTIKQCESNQLSTKEIETLVQILHKYKVGSESLWKSLFSRLSQLNIMPAEHIFAFLSGFYRSSFSCNRTLFITFINLDPNMSYIDKLDEREFVELFIVLYANLRNMTGKEKRRITECFITSILKKELCSVYEELKYFFLFLLSNNETEKKEFLEKSYPTNIQCSLLSLEFPNIISMDSVETVEYEEELKKVYGEEKYTENRYMAIVEEFIRFKLSSSQPTPSLQPTSSTASEEPSHHSSQ